jgi:hypothetical protein
VSVGLGRGFPVYRMQPSSRNHVASCKTKAETVAKNARRHKPWKADVTPPGGEVRGWFQHPLQFFSRVRSNNASHPRASRTLRKENGGFDLLLASPLSHATNRISKNWWNPKPKKKANHQPSLVAIERGSVIRTPDHSVEQLRRFREIGVNYFLLIFSDDTLIQPLETFRDEVIPRLR